MSGVTEMDRLTRLARLNGLDLHNIQLESNRCQFHELRWHQTRMWVNQCNQEPDHDGECTYPDGW